MALPLRNLVSAAIPKASSKLACTCFECKFSGAIETVEGRTARAGSTADVHEQADALAHVRKHRAIYAHRHPGIGGGERHSYIVSR